MPDQSETLLQAHRDAVAAARAAAAATTATVASGNPFPRLAVREQKPGDNTCVAVAFATAIDLCRNAGFPFARISVDDVFSRMNHEPSPAAGAATVRSGVADESWWPPGAPSPATPPETLYRATVAQPHDVGASNLVKHLCDAIDSRQPLVAFIPLFRNFEAYNGTGLYVPHGRSAGAHAICIVGYASPTSGGGSWIAVNSWAQRGEPRATAVSRGWNPPSLSKKTAS